MTTTDRGDGPTTPVADPARADDAHLRAWRDAARTGGLPLTHRHDRWQALRAGVVNLWEFEVAEYWFADGWAQLTGSNETGKSSLMAMTTLIPWLGSVASANIDTLGEHGKTFRYYVEPTGRDDDRRPADASTSEGWLWVEYGRLTEDGAQFFTTAMFARVRRASTSFTPRWCTIDGSRVGDGVDLVLDRAVVPPDRAAEAVEQHPTATAYRQRVAARLLGGTSDQLDGIGKLLRTTRTPKLGERLNVGFVTGKLREALPELAQQEIDALTAGWDELDQVQADARSAKEAAQSVRTFRTRSWMPWAAARLRIVADDGAAARTEFDAVTRRVREAQATLHEVDAEAEAVTTERVAEEGHVEVEERSLTELRESTAYRNAQGRLDRLAQLHADLARIEGHLRRATEESERADRQADETREELARARQDSGAAEEAVRAQAATLATRVTEAGLPESTCADLSRLRQALHERAADARHARELHGRFDRAHSTAQVHEDIAAQYAADHADAEKSAQSARAAAETARDVLAAAVSRWAAALEPTPPPRVVDAWVDGLPGDEPGERLQDAARRDWYAAPAARLLEDAASTREEIRRREAEIAALDAEISGLHDTVDPSFPEPVGWARRARPAPGPHGAPLWRLVNPRTEDDDLADLEAALAAAGILDAWVTHDGVHLPARDEADTIVDLRVPTEPIAGPCLADVLEAADGDDGLGGVVARLLAAVAMTTDDGHGDDDGHGGDDGAGGSGYVVTLDGRWRTPLLSGHAVSVHGQAEWIGQDARERGRQRRIAELERRRDEVREATEAHRRRHALLEEARAHLDAGLAACPDDEPLRRQIDEAERRAESAEEAATRSRRAQRAAQEARAAADVLRAALHEHAASRRLPTVLTEIDALAARIDEAERALGAVIAEQRVLDLRRGEQARVAKRAEEAAVLSRRRAEEKDAVARDLDATRAQAAVVEAAVGADDREILERVEGLQESVRAGRGRLTRLTKKATELAVRSGVLRSELGRAEADRDAARARRDSVYDRFRGLVDGGLVDEAGIVLPQADSTSVEATRAQVAAVREAVEIRGWPSSQDEQAREVDRRFQRLTTAVAELRSSLEAGGRSVRLDDEGDIPTVTVVVDSTGAAWSPRHAAVRLGEIHETLAAAYDERMQALLSELLGSTFINHLRDRLASMRRLVADINHVLAAHPTGTTRTALRLKLTPLAGVTGEVLAALEDVGGAALLDPTVAAQVRSFLRARVDGAKEAASAAGHTDWATDLAVALDYRLWFDVGLEKRSGTGGSWAPLTPSAYADASGGARVVMLMTPLIATLAALYSGLSGAPRPLWLDEAFDGLDTDNRATVLDLLRQFDLDVLIAGPGRLVNSRVVPAAAIYQVVRAPHPQPGADLLLELWAGRELTPIDLPLPTSRSASASHGDGDDGDGDGDDLFSASVTT